jgi:hypothetical protein
MPAISLASAADLNHADDLPVGRYAHVRKPSPMALVPEAARIAIAQGCDDVMSLVRQTWFYRQMLSGPVPVRIHAYTDDHRTRVLQDADALMRGRFRLGGQAVDIRQGSIFDQPAPSAEFAAALHGFDWLRHLEAAGGDLAREFALKLTQHWLNRNARYTIPAWRPDVTAERFINLFCHGRFFLGDLDEAWRVKFFTSLRDQALVLGRSLHRAPEGLPRLKCAAALALSGFCLGDDRFAAAALGNRGDGLLTDVQQCPQRQRQRTPQRMSQGQRNRDPHMSVEKRLIGRRAPTRSGGRRGIVVNVDPFDLRAVALGGRIVDHQQQALGSPQQHLLRDLQAPRRNRATIRFTSVEKLDTRSKQCRALRGPPTAAVSTRYLAMRPGRHGSGDTSTCARKHSARQILCMSSFGIHPRCTRGCVHPCRPSASLSHSILPANIRRRSSHISC